MSNHDEYKSILLSYAIGRNPETKEVVFMAHCKDAETGELFDMNYNYNTAIENVQEKPIYRVYKHASNLAHCLHDMIEKDRYGITIQKTKCS